jgi:hypothetical protein
MILMPNTGRLTITRGRMAQCTAQARELAIPNASQLMDFFDIRMQK